MEQMEETDEFLRTTFHVDSIDKDVLEFCFSRADGTPATLERLLRSLLETSIFVIEGGTILLNEDKVTDRGQLQELETPDGVRDLIRSRVAKLDSESLHLLFLASTLGTHFSFGLLDESYKMKEVGTRGPERHGNETPAAALNRVIKYHMLEVVDGVGPMLSATFQTMRKTVTLRFTSEAQKHTIYDMQSIHVRCANHLAAARAMETILMGMQNTAPLGPSSGVRRLVGPPGTVQSRTMKRSAHRRSQRRGSISRPEERKGRSEQEALPKIAMHLEKAGKELRALDFYFKAFTILDQSGSKAAIQMLRKCVSLAETLGDSVSSFQLCEFQYNIARILIESGEVNEALDMIGSALDLLDESCSPSVLSIFGDLASLWLHESLCSARESSHDKDVELKQRLFSLYAQAAGVRGEAMQTVFSTLRVSWGWERGGGEREKRKKKRGKRTEAHPPHPLRAPWSALGKFRAKREITLIARGMKLTILCSRTRPSLRSSPRVLDSIAVDEHSEPLTVRDLASANANLAIVLLIIGLRSMASNALARSLQISGLLTIDGAWRMWLFQGAALFSFGRMDEAQIILRHAIEQADEFGPRYFFFTYSALNIAIHCHCLELGDAIVGAGKMMSYDSTESLPEQLRKL